ncbi:MAG: histidinol-phosphate transaminase [candidate division WOR-3 bacterium]|nr:histidinol-phosphate transaminase [candidate division WOR-3 bacterium]
MMLPLPRPNLANVKPYKPGKPIEELIRELKLKGEVIKLASNENPLGASPKAIAAIRKFIAESYLYPDDNVYYLRQALAKKFKLDMDWVMVGDGSVELIYLACLAYLRPEDELLVSEHSFIIAKIGARVMDSRVTEIPLRDDYTHDLSRILKSINSATKIIYIDNPINPLGTIVKKRELGQFIEQVPEDVLVILDEAYYEYIATKDYPDSIKYLRNGKNVMILRTYSKIYGLAGLRLGYGLSKPEIIANLMKVRYPFNVNRLAQIAGIAALKDLRHAQRSRKINEAGKKFLYPELKKLKLFFIPTYANFIFVSFVEDSHVIYERLLRLGVITRTVKEYGFPNALRITIGTPAQNRRLIEALKQVVRR